MWTFQGCKLWLRSTLSPSVMRNTLLGQCFHTRNEKIHKDIFDLLPPFLQACLWTISDLFVNTSFVMLANCLSYFTWYMVLSWHYWCRQVLFVQSLEALQDGEHEKQRRHFLYFLLHQVPVSSNFNVLTRKLACKVFQLFNIVTCQIITTFWCSDFFFFFGSLLYLLQDCNFR